MGFLRHLALSGANHTNDDGRRRRIVVLNVMCLSVASIVALYVPIYAAAGSTLLAWLCAAVCLQYGIIFALNAGGRFDAARATYFVSASTIIAAFASMSGPEAGVQYFLFLLLGIVFLFCSISERKLIGMGIVCPLVGWAACELTDYGLFGPRQLDIEIAEAMYWIIIPTIAMLTVILTISFSLASERAHRRLDERARQLAEANEQLRADAELRERMARELRLAQKLEAVGQLAAGIAHEINTPIQYVGDNVHYIGEAFAELEALIRSYDELHGAARDAGFALDLLKGVAQRLEDADLEYHAEEVPRAIQHALDGVGQVSKIVRAVKSFSHPGTGEPAPVDINNALETCLVMARNEWKLVAEIETSLDAELPQVIGLGGELNQVFLNILVNAAHAIAAACDAETAQKGRIGLTTRSDGSTVEVRISDTGVGIPVEFQERIFEPFYTTKEVGKGTGQGLAIAHRIVVENHGGELSLTSRPAEGTTFVIRLPVDSRDAAGKEDDRGCRQVDSDKRQDAFAV